MQCWSVLNGPTENDIVRRMEEAAAGGLSADQGRDAPARTGDASRTRHLRRSVAGQEDDVAVLDLAGLVEERGEGAGDGGCVGAVLGEGLGRDKD